MLAALMIGAHSSISSSHHGRSLIGRCARRLDAEHLVFLLGLGLFQHLATLVVHLRHDLAAASWPGANSPYHDETLNPGTPASAKVGSSGASGERSGVDCANPRTWPERTAWSNEPVVLNMQSMRLVMRSLMAPAATPR